MSNFSDFVQNNNAVQRFGLSRQDVAQLARSRATLVNGTADPMIDDQWAGYDATGAPNSYFDYFFSGQDVTVYIDGIEGESEFATMPFADFSFNIVQQKMPIYGFWSYTFDSVARGSRIINGSFRLVTKSPDYMRRALEAAAQVRQLKVRGNVTGSFGYYRGLTPDDANIEKYWGKNIDPALVSTGKQIFSTHPPFTFVIVYGVQSMSLNENTRLSGAYQAYQDDNPMYQDTNERLVDSDPFDQANRIILNDVELMNMSTEIHSTGQLVVEDYQFIARDYIIPAKSSVSTVKALPALNP